MDKWNILYKNVLFDWISTKSDIGRLSTKFNVNEQMKCTI